MGEDWPPEPWRCPHCRLLIGAGRARSEPSDEPGARGSAAGVFAHQAKRSGRRGRRVRDDVCSAIRRVAEATGARPERLLMVDYQQEAADDASLPPLSDVFAAYGSWKRARRAAAALEPDAGLGSASHAEGRVPAAMEVLLVLVPFVVAGIAVIFIAFSGGPAAAREAYLTRGGRASQDRDPAALRGARRSRARRGDRVARRGRGRRRQAPHRGAQRRRRRRASGSSARPAGAATTSTPSRPRESPGPTSTTLGVDRQRVLNAIERGGTGDGRMPAGLLQGEEARAVAAYVAKVAGQ